MTITFDSVDITTAPYVPRFIKHETVPERILSLMSLAREDGSVIIAEKYGVKHILLQGIIYGSTQSDLETKIDSFKELFSREAKDLDISWEAGTRRYVATCVSHKFNRDSFNISMCPWTADFIVPEGVGNSTAITALVHELNIDTLPHTGILTFEGSAEPRPVILLTVDSGWTNARGMSFENTDTGEKLVINTGWFGITIDDGDKFEIDCENKTVRWYHNGSWGGVSFGGVSPHFVIGENNYKIEAGDIIDQQYTEGDGGIAIYDTNIMYQSFTVPRSVADYKGISLKLKKNGTPPNNLVITILEDSDGTPDAGSPVANASFEIAPGDVATSDAWIFKNSTGFFGLDANKTYWIKATMTAGDVNNHFVWTCDYSGKYPRGSASIHPGWDFLFKLYYTGRVDTAPVQLLDVDYYKRYL